MNGKVVAVSEEGAIVVIKKEVTVIFENGKVIANGEAECEVEPSAAASEGEVVSEAIAPVSVEVNGESVAVAFYGAIFIVKGHANMKKIRWYKEDDPEVFRCHLKKFKYKENLIY